MTMVRNESVTRIVMLLCFGTAILSLFVHWRMTTTETSSKDAIRREALRSSSASASSSQTLHTSSGTASQNITGGAYVPKKQQNQTAYNSPKPLFLPSLGQKKPLNNSVFGNTEVVVDLSDRRVYVYRGGVTIASYPTGIGKKGWETPTGSFEIMHMQHYPVWRHPITGKIFEAGPDSPLGDRWIGFWSDGRNKIGFHGTPDDDLVGKAISHGCLRMRNPDVRMLYKQVGLGTTVVVRH
jgi:lipoprotein-anchoring transpeptidase ErfK/SrfK